LNQNHQNAISNPSGEDSFFDDDFEQAIDLEAVTAIERNQKVTGVVQDRFENTRTQRPIINEKTNEIEESLEDINFEPLENWLV
jgi:hypothetical protein